MYGSGLVMVCSITYALEWSGLEDSSNECRLERATGRFRLLLLAGDYWNDVVADRQELQRR
jgi:hypothetical protein